MSSSGPSCSAAGTAESQRKTRRTGRPSTAIPPPFLPPPVLVSKFPFVAANFCLHSGLRVVLGALNDMMLLGGAVRRSDALSRPRPRQQVQALIEKKYPAGSKFLLPNFEPLSPFKPKNERFLLGLEVLPGRLGKVLGEYNPAHEFQFESNELKVWRWGWPHHHPQQVLFERTPSPSRRWYPRGFCPF